MSVLQIYAVRDTAAEAYISPPIFVPARGAAMRAFMDALDPNAQASPFNKHPQHFELWYVGDYNTQTGEITGKTPEYIVKGVDILPSAA